MFRASRVMMFIPEAEWNEAAAGLAFFALALEPTCNLEEVYYFILDMFEMSGGEITLEDLQNIAMMATFYRAAMPNDFETNH